MRRAWAWTVACLAASSVLTVAQEGKPASTHVLVQGAELKWGDGPPGLPKGATMAVLSGDPGQPGPYVLRAKMPAGYTIPPHWHPNDENLTVLAGTFALGTGDKLDPAAARDVNARGFSLMPANMHHFAIARTAVILQVHGIGPFAINYINPADDPRQATPAK
jgi:quercetin dioxygenase-like cupin family protein